MIRVWLTGLAFTALLGAPLAAAGEGEVDAQTRERVTTAIADYVRHDSQLKGGFLIIDPRTDAPLELAFDHVHEGVHATEDGAWVACVDFTDTAGALYDVDVVVRLGEEAEVERVFLHKVNGRAVGGQ